MRPDASERMQARSKTAANLNKFANTSRNFARTLLSSISFSELPWTEPEPMVAQLQQLHWRLFGQRVEADGPEVTANLELWEELYELSYSPTTAWKGVLTVLLRDPNLLLY